jgi:UDP-N-acetylglucosamine 2-epimerase (non-hydrolysing)
MVHGDTLSTLVASLLARFHGVDVIHVEAGLRSRNIFNPFPEELTRIAVSKLASVFYCNGETAIANIKAMKPGARIIDVGENTLLDSVRAAAGSVSKKDGPRKNAYCVASIHRFENLSNNHRLKFIIENIINISKSLHVYFVLHSATQHQLQKSGLLQSLEKESGITLSPRMNYFDFIKLISDSRFLISDGGSNQEECSYLEIPCLLMRRKTERTEGLGKNVHLSNYSQEVIDFFLNEYGTHERTTLWGLEQYSALPSLKIADDMAALLRDQTESKAGI